MTDIDPMGALGRAIERARADRKEQAEPTLVQLQARRGGKTQAMIESLLAQANERGIRVEVVYPQGEPSDAAVLAFSNSFYDYDPPVTDLDYWSPAHVANVRAALRAALRAAAVQEGGTR